MSMDSQESIFVHTYVGGVCEEGSVRIVGSTRLNEGRVEVCQSGQWGAVCCNRWDANDAKVVCRQLGYTSLGKEGERKEGGVC